MPELPTLPPIADQPLSVVLLARDCADHVVVSLIVWLAFLDERRPGAYELILVDDSADGTADRAQAQADAFPAVRVIRLDQPRGEGAALRAGLGAATKPLVFYTLCDPAYRPEMLGGLLDRTITLDGVEAKEIDQVHLMTGFRAGVKIPAILRALGWLWRALCMVLVANAPHPSPGWLGWRRQFGWLLSRALFGLRQGDVACPFRLMRREILARIPIQSDGPFAHVELLAKANFLGCIMGEEAPLDVRPPDYRGDAGRFLADGKKVFNRPDFGPAVLPAPADAPLSVEGVMAKKKAPPQEQAFLDDVIEHPADDAPRLVFADWLEDQGQGRRAEFIRLQCQLAGLHDGDPRREALEERLRELLAVHREEWRTALPAWLLKGAGRHAHVFRRGFIDRVSLTVSEFLERGKGVFAAFPIRDLHLRAAAGRMAEVGASPLLRRLAALDLSKNDLTDDDAAAVTVSPYLTGLTSLSLRKAGVRPYFAELLTGWQQLGRLTSLDLGDNDLQPEVFRALAKAPLPSLRLLHLTASKPDAASLRAFLAGGRLAGLTRLDVRSTESSVILPAVVKPGALPSLRSLDASGYWANREALALLGGSELLEGLEVLRLSSAGLFDGHLRALTKDGRTGRLRDLDLTYNSNLRSPDAMAALASASLGSLRRLDLRATQLDADSLRVLGKAPWLAGLRALSLSGLQFGDAGVEALTESHLTGLTFLSLERTGIGPRGAAMLAAWPGLAQVRHLHLSGNPFGTEGVRSLAASPHLRNVYHLSLGTSGMTDDGVRALAASSHLGNLRILNLWGYDSPDDSALRELANSPRLPRLLILKVQVVMIDSPKELQDLGRTISL